MLILGIDTSDKFVSVGLWGDGTTIKSIASHPDLRNKNELHKMIESIFVDSGLNIDDLDGVAVSIGPGSFTGLRVGLAAAKAICWSLNIPLAGVSSLEAIAKSDTSGAEFLITIKEARRGELYIAGYQIADNEANLTVPEHVIKYDDILHHINQQFNIIGPGSDSIIAILPDDLKRKILPFNPDNLGGTIARIGAKMIEKGEIIDVSSAVPEYIRDPELGGS